MESTNNINSKYMKYKVIVKETINSTTKITTGLPINILEKLTDSLVQILILNKNG